MGKDTFSVVCPTYNSAKFIERAIWSVYEQTIAPRELIIVDDGSSDNTVDVINGLRGDVEGKFDLILLKIDHAGPSVARNSGIRVSRSEWVAFLDSDDMWYPKKLEIVLGAMKCNQNKNFFCHNEELVLPNGEKFSLIYGENYSQKISLSKQLYRSNMFSTSAVVCSLNLLQNHGVFDDSYETGQDYELWLRLSPHMKPQFIDHILGAYNMRVDNITSSKFGLRLKNEIRIAIKYKKFVGLTPFFIRLIRILGSFARQHLRNIKFMH